MSRGNDHEQAGGPSRRHALESMVWAGTGILWTMSGRIPKSLNLLTDAKAAERRRNE